MSEPKFKSGQEVRILQDSKYTIGIILKVIPANMCLSKNFIKKYCLDLEANTLDNPRNYNRYIVDVFTGFKVLTEGALVDFRNQTIKEPGPEMLTSPLGARVRSSYSESPNKDRKPLFSGSTNETVFPGSSYIARKLSTIPPAFKNSIAQKHGFKTYQAAKDHKRQPYERFSLKMIKQEIRYEWSKLMSPASRQVGNYEEAIKRNSAKSALLGLRYGGSADSLSMDLHNQTKVYIENLPEGAQKEKLKKAFAIANEITDTAKQIIEQFAIKKSEPSIKFGYADSHGDTLSFGSFSKSILDKVKSIRYPYPDINFEEINQHSSDALAYAIKHRFGSAPQKETYVQEKRVSRFGAPAHWPLNAPAYNSLEGWEFEKQLAIKQIKNMLTIAWYYAQDTPLHRQIADRLSEIAKRDGADVSLFGKINNIKP